MKKILFPLALCALLLCLGLAACTPVAEVTPGPVSTATPVPTQEASAPPTPTPTATPTPKPTLEPTSVPTPEPTLEPPLEPTPTPEPADPSVARLKEILKKGLSGEQWGVRCWVDPGSGPWTGTLYAEDCGDTLREFFASFDWQPGQGSPRPNTSNWYTVDLCFKGGLIQLGNYQSRDTITYILSETNETATFHALGADSLCVAVANLLVDPTLRYYFVAVSNQGTDQAQGERFAKCFCEHYLSSGVISDFRLNEVKSFTRTLEGDIWKYLKLSYAVKPTDPQWKAWQKYEVTDDGWVEFEHTITLRHENLTLTSWYK